MRTDARELRSPPFGGRVTAMRQPGLDDAEPVVVAQGVVTRFGTQTVHEGIDFAVHRGDVVALIGGSGSGKSVLLREIIGLIRPTAGRFACSAPTYGTAMMRS